MSLHVAAVEFLPDGVAITYMVEPDDVRVNGLVSQHRLFVPSGSDYDDELEEAEGAIKSLLADALDDLETVDHVHEKEEEEE